MNANLLSYDGKRLPFPDNYFDAVYSYHVLEHVRDVTNVMAETRRVLRPRGLFYVGVPNKSRLFAYTGMNDKSVYQKVRQNVRDWSKRLQGEWDNSLGAHAGFREAELTKQLARFFSRIVPVTRFYYTTKWSKYQSILKLVFKFSLDKIMLPSLYVLASGQKRDYHEEYQDWRY